jgi:hypothetical protein
MDVNFLGTMRQMAQQGASTAKVGASLTAQFADVLSMAMAGQNVAQVGTNPLSSSLGQGTQGGQNAPAAITASPELTAALQAFRSEAEATLSSLFPDGQVQPGPKFDGWAQEMVARLGATLDRVNAIVSGQDTGESKPILEWVLSRGEDKVAPVDGPEEATPKALPDTPATKLAANADAAAAGTTGAQAVAVPLSDTVGNTAARDSFVPGSAPGLGPVIDRSVTNPFSAAQNGTPVAVPGVAQPLGGVAGPSQQAQQAVTGQPAPSAPAANTPATSTGTDQQMPRVSVPSTTGPIVGAAQPNATIAASQNAVPPAQPIIQAQPGQTPQPDPVAPIQRAVQPTPQIAQPGLTKSVVPKAAPADTHVAAPRQAYAPQQTLTPGIAAPFAPIQPGLEPAQAVQTAPVAPQPGGVTIPVQMPFVQGQTQVQPVSGQPALVPNTGANVVAPTPIEAPIEAPVQSAPTTPSQINPLTPQASLATANAGQVAPTDPRGTPQQVQVQQTTAPVSPQIQPNEAPSRLARRAVAPVTNAGAATTAQAAQNTVATAVAQPTAPTSDVPAGDRRLVRQAIRLLGSSDEARQPRSSTPAFPQSQNVQTGQADETDQNVLAFTGLPTDLRVILVNALAQSPREISQLVGETTGAGANMTSQAIAAAPAMSAVAPRPGTGARASSFASNIAAQIKGVSFAEGTTRVELMPKGLGGIEIEIARDDAGKLRVVLRAENPAVLNAMRTEREVLVTMLRDGGTSVDDGAVSFESARDGREGQGQSQSGGRPAMQQGGGSNPQGNRADPSANEANDDPQPEDPNDANDGPIIGDDGRLNVLT